jgi:hypothetical protein
MINGLEKQRDLAGSFNRLFTSPDGQKVVDHLYFRFHLGSTTFKNNADDLGSGSEAMTLREGQRSVVLYIQDLINFDFEAAEKAIEAEDEESSDEFAT